MKSKLCLLVLCGGLLASMPVSAHHSFASEYDRERKVKVTGTITKFDLSNPHSWVYVDVKEADGTVSNWAFVKPPPAADGLYRKGELRKDILETNGMVITIHRVWLR